MILVQKVLKFKCPQKISQLYIIFESFLSLTHTEYLTTLFFSRAPI